MQDEAKSNRFQQVSVAPSDRDGWPMVLTNQVACEFCDGVTDAPPEHGHLDLLESGDELVFDGILNLVGAAQPDTLKVGAEETSQKHSC